MEKIIQQNSCDLYIDKKTVDWLVENTKVRTFNKITFTGYQRKVNANHVNKIVDYIKTNKFFLPTAIICSTDEEYKETTKLFIVDGQHRVEAFKKIKENDPSKFNDLKDLEVGIIVLDRPSESEEVNTFITINKTSKKVDTSLAYVLKNKISRQNGGSDSIELSQREFLSVELAILLNESERSIWNNRIFLDGNPTSKSFETISLNAFVNSMKSFINHLNKANIIKITWENEEELKNILESIYDIYTYLWEQIKFKWLNQLETDYIKDSVLLGTIGVSSINKYIIMKLKDNSNINSSEELKNRIKDWIQNLNISSSEWSKGNRFSQFSSASGINIVAKILYDSYRD